LKNNIADNIAGLKVADKPHAPERCQDHGSETQKQLLSDTHFFPHIIIPL
jgi:hypothetical protein